MSGQRQVPAASPPFRVKLLLYPMNWRLGLDILEEKKFLPLPGIEPRVVAMATMLS